MSHGMEDEALESLPSPEISDGDESFEPLPDDSTSSQTSSDSDDHDVAELFSRPRIVPHCSAQWQLVGGPSVDIKTGVDLLDIKNRIETQRKLDKHRTKVVVLSPPYSRIEHYDTNKKYRISFSKRCRSIRATSGRNGCRKSAAPKPTKVHV